MSDIFQTAKINELETAEKLTGTENVLIDDGTYTKKTTLGAIAGHIIDEIDLHNNKETADIEEITDLEITDLLNDT